MSLAADPGDALGVESKRVATMFNRTFGVEIKDYNGTQAPVATAL
ncbi:MULTISPECIES: hypothetical protein [Cyanophyceae]|nr:hypothetical protein [Phormidium sp. FACHB-592]